MDEKSAVEDCEDFIIPIDSEMNPRNYYYIFDLKIKTLMIIILNILFSC